MENKHNIQSISADEEKIRTWIVDELTDFITFGDVLYYKTEEQTNDDGNHYTVYREVA